MIIKSSFCQTVLSLFIAIYITKVLYYKSTFANLIKTINDNKVKAIYKKIDHTCQLLYSIKVFTSHEKEAAPDIQIRTS